MKRIAAVLIATGSALLVSQSASAQYDTSETTTTVAATTTAAPTTVAPASVPLPATGAPESSNTAIQTGGILLAAGAGMLALTQVRRRRNGADA